MRKKFLVVIAALVWSSGAVQAQTVDELVGKYVQAMGGADKLSGLKAVKINSTMKIMGADINSTTTAVNQRAFRQDMSIQGMTVVQVIDGNKGWTVNPMMGQSEATALPEDQTKAMADQLDLTGSLFNYKEKGNTVELAGKENVNTTDTYKVKVTRKNGNVEYHYLDAKTYLPVKILAVAKIQGQDLKQETLNSNFKQVAGITFPFTVEMKNDAIPGGSSLTVNVTKIDINPSIDESIFKMPAKK